MKKTKKILILFLVMLVIFFLGFLGIKKILSKTPEPRVYSKQSSVAGVVEIEAVPKELKAGSEMIFTLSLNNHSIDLSYDFTKIAFVVDNKGNTYKPIKWIGGSGGHHVSGDLIFDKLSNKATQVGLKITGVDSKDLVFGWNL